MKLFNLSVYPTSLPKGSPLGRSLVTLGNLYRTTPVGATTKTVHILHQVSSALHHVTRFGSMALLQLLKGQAASQQNIYAPVMHQPVNGLHAPSHLIRFSNGRTPYTAKQVIF